jgi:hypothetical protein
MGAGYVIINPLSVSEITLIIKNSVVSLQILAPNWHQIKNTYNFGLCLFTFFKPDVS